MDEYNAIEAQPECFASEQEYRKAILQEIDKTQAARRKLEDVVCPK